MEGGITDDARSTMLRAALARVGREEMKAGLAPPPIRRSPRPKRYAMPSMPCRSKKTRSARY